MEKPSGAEQCAKGHLAHGDGSLLLGVTHRDIRLWPAQQLSEGEAGHFVRSMAGAETNRSQFWWSCELIQASSGNRPAIGKNMIRASLGRHWDITAAEQTPANIKREGLDDASRSTSWQLHLIEQLTRGAMVGGVSKPMQASSGHP